MKHFAAQRRSRRKRQKERMEFWMIGMIWRGARVRDQEIGMKKLRRKKK